MKRRKWPTRALPVIVVLCSAPIAQAAGTDQLRAIALFKATFQDRCAEDAFSDDMLSGTEAIPLQFRSPYAEADEPDWSGTLYQFFCDRFAHSGSAAFVLKDPEGAFRVLSFAEPYIGPAEPSEGNKLPPNGFVGFFASDTVLNADFDPSTRTLTSETHDLGRDYRTSWIFIDGDFVFVGNNSFTMTNGKLVERPAGSSQ